MFNKKSSAFHPATCNDIESEDEDHDIRIGDIHPDHSLQIDRIPSNSLYIEVIHHPHSGGFTTTIIPIASQIGSDKPVKSSVPEAYQIPVRGKPWAPFRTREDFEFAELAVTEGFNSHCIQKTLDGVNGRWARKSRLTIMDTNDLKESIAAAQRFVTQMSYQHIWE
ncbi:hypothetical protein M422DRAFT_264558 [Sphaerobolus stellatus SS14]|uniref:Uncharacterized protein n=1 Tax=Sphaerobolus stellatus (strain SS14) TaxID=990650 RepID=A0A0C9UFD0_SPHS4|nr:hypothetical protein M422DRAFT_264558 [Sphaerobolus stellatus SS14]